MFFDDIPLITRKETRLRTPPIPYTDWRPPTELPDLSHAKVISFDTETRELDFDHGPGWARGKGHIVGASIAARFDDSRQYCAYVPLRHEVERDWNCDVERSIRWLKTCLETPRIPKVGANLLYDIGWLAEEGITVAGDLYDVQFAEALLDETASTALEALGRKYVGEGKDSDILYKWLSQSYGGQPNGLQRANIYRAPARLVGQYAESDAALPLTILERQWPRLEAEGLIDLFRMECAAIPMLVKMRQAGVRVDVKKAEELHHELGIDIARLYDEVRHTYGVAIDSVSAAAQVARVFDAVGLPYLRTAEGTPSFRKEWLSTHSHPLAAKINEIREYEKIRGTFIESYILGNHNNGRLHCQFHPLRSDDGGAKTGRYSSSDPNLQNIPTRTELGKRVRRLFIPDEGHLCWEKNDHCVTPDSRILTVDMRHIRADEIRPGDHIIAFDEQTSFRRKLRKTRVTAVKNLREPCVRITTTGGIVECSTLHRWLSKTGYSQKYDWKRAKDIRVGDFIPRVCDVWEPKTDYESGWFAGLLDGEGWRVNGYVGVAQKEGKVLQRARRWLHDNGYIWFERINSLGRNPTDTVISLMIEGGRRASWRLLGETRPSRLLDNNERLIDGVALQSRTSPPDIVTKIEYLGEREVVAIETEHKTLVVNGLMSHNSQIEYRMLAHFAVGPGSEELRETYRRDPRTDYHDRVFQKFCVQVGLDYAHMAKEEKATRRKPLKNINFGLIYGQSQPSLAYKAGMSKKDADEFFETYHESAPYVKPTMKAIAASVQECGYIQTILGRRVRFNLWEPRKHEKGLKPLPYRAALAAYGSNIKRAGDYKGTNYTFQGSAADIMKAGMLKAYYDGVYDVIGYPKMQVHDELDFSVIDDNNLQKSAYDHLRYCLENAIPTVRVPLFVDSERGSNWGECK